MNLYDFCRAVALNADRRAGIAVCTPLVDDHRMLLNRPSSEDEFRAAFRWTLRTFAPHDEVRLVNFPFTSRSMALFLVVQIAGCGQELPRDVWLKNPVIQSYLAAAMRHLLRGLVAGAEPQGTKRPAARAPQPPPPALSRAEGPPRHPNEAFLTREDNVCLQWGNLTSDAAYVMALAERLRPLRMQDRQIVVEAIRDDIADLEEITIEDFTNRLRTYTGVPAAKA